MIYLKKSKNIFVSLLFSGSVNSNLYCKCCPCNKNNSSSGDGGEEKDKDNKDKKEEQNKNVINDLEGVVGLTCKLENNKVCLYTKVPGNDNYNFAESVEDFNGEFKYENFKDLRINIKIKEFGIDWKDDCTIKKQIRELKKNLLITEDFKFLQNKIIIILYHDEGGYEYLCDLSDMRVYANETDNKNSLTFIKNVDFSDPDNFNLKEYGMINSEEKGERYYIDADNDNGYDDSDEKQEEYKKAFFDGK